MISLFAAPTQRFDGEPDAAPRPLDDVRAEIDAAVGRGARWIDLDRPEPTAHPEILAILDHVAAAGARARFATNGRRLPDKAALERLRDAGLAHLTFDLWGGTAATHDARVGEDGAFERQLQAIEAASRVNNLFVIVRYVLMADNAEELPGLVARVRDPADRFDLCRLSTLTRDAAFVARHGVRRAVAQAAVQAAWEAARGTHLKLTTDGFSSWPDVPGPTDGPVQPVDGTLIELLRAHVPVPSVSGGTWATPAADPAGIWQAVEKARSLHELGLQLAAHGCPALDLPPSMGGLGLDAPPDGTSGGPPDAPPLRRIDGVPMALRRLFPDTDARPLPGWSGVAPGTRAAVVVGHLTDHILALSTLPHLGPALARHGLPTVVHTVWDAPTNPHDPGPALPPTLTPEGGPADWRLPEAWVDAIAARPDRIAWAHREADRWLRSLDLTGIGLVVTAGFDNAIALLDNPTLAADARIVLADFHLMTGIGRWHERFAKGQRPMDGGWWPDERILVHALYPRTVRAYFRSGVPLRQVTWRPYPLHLGHFPPGPPTTACAALFAGGSHQRDWRTLARAVTPELAQRIVLHSAEVVPPPLRGQGEIRLLDFYAAIARSRFVILPLRPDDRRPAGISVISMALAAGRPLVATCTDATLDHLRHEQNALLVPPGDPEALAAAIRRLDEDDDLLARLSSGARRAADALSVDAWARTLAHGAPPQVTWPSDGNGRGPYYAWP